MNLLATSLYLLIIASIHALWEIEIEGKCGWARKLPTFRINVFFRKLLGGKPLTGYHLYMLLIFQFLFHGIYLFIPFTWATECNLQATMSIYWILEDILWFIFNPHYTFRRFRRKQIEWHKRWLGPLPLSYWTGLLISTVLFLIGAHING